MRALAVALLLSMPLSAGDKSSLENAVELFRSPDAGKRAAGSQMAERELRRLLAPLLEAMQDDDPEVRRRVLRSILSLVPGEADAEEHAALLVRVQRLQAQAAALHQMQAVADRTRKATQLLGVFGIQRRGPDERGFRVPSVRGDSQAARLGLRADDSICRLNGRAVATVHDCLAALGDKANWSSVTATVLRDGQFVRLTNK